MAPGLPPEITVFERGWLSANNVLLLGREQAALVDSGYCTHAAQTLALVGGALGGRPLDRLLNTHLHSDHCGGNAALQQRYPLLETLIPPGQAAHVDAWDTEALSYRPTGQQCPRFKYDALLRPGAEVVLADRAWQIHAAPGHDPDATMLFEPMARLLLSGDALWESGFGVVFPELEGQSAFDQVAETLDVIDALQPEAVVPGHGAVFSDVVDALARARRRLDAFVQNPRRHALHAAKVLLKYKLLELQRVARVDFERWARQTPYFEIVRHRYFEDADAAAWFEQLTQELVRAGAARLEGGFVLNA
ncbi:MAG: MBL-fold metallo-hydrolase superfamily [Burkholderiaceae bacterium]|jgi:glyoxylase-like metal-dependent hydrolase (beta-lactamase superfamily II)|nr:MAG: MBL-fold metallo-hydrolase superfamily [Burkholderiaceae bacterium]